MPPSNLTEEDIKNPFYTVRDIALLFKVQESTVRRWFNEDLIDNAINLAGRSWRARRSDVMDFAQRKYGSDFSE